MVYSLRIGTKKFARLYVEVPIADKIGRNGGTSFVTGLNLWTLHNPYIIPCLLPHAFKNWLIPCLTDVEVLYLLYALD